MIKGNVMVSDFPTSPSKHQDLSNTSLVSAECNRLSVQYQHMALTEMLLNLDIWSACSNEVQLLVYKSLTRATCDITLADAMVNHAVIPKIVAKVGNCANFPCPPSALF